MAARAPRTCSALLAGLTALCGAAGLCAAAPAPAATPTAAKNPKTPKAPPKNPKTLKAPKVAKTPQLDASKAATADKAGKAATDGDDPRAAEAARAALRAGEPRRAITVLEAAIARRSTPELQRLLGDAYAAVTDPPERREATARALRAYRRFLLEEQDASPELRVQTLSAVRALRQRRDEDSPLDPSALRPEPPRFAGAAARLAAPQTTLAMPPLGDSWRRRQHLAALGLSAAALMLGAGGAVLTAQAVDLADDAARTNDADAAQTLRTESRARLGGGITCLALAGGAAVTATVLWVRARRPSYALAPILTPGQLGLTLAGRF